MTRREAARLIALGAGRLLCVRAPAGLAPGHEQPPPRRSAALEEVVERVRREHDLPGLAAAVVAGSRGTLSAVTGLRRRGDRSRIALGDRFHIASLTKSWTATLAGIAVSRGQLGWTTTLGEALPGLAARMRSEYARATLEQLLAHEARLPAYTQPSARQVEEMRALRGTGAEQRLAFLARALREEPNDAAGDGAYSNVGYAAAGAMLEAVTGTTWEVLVRRELAAPLRLTSVGFGYPATAAHPDQPRGHADGAELPLDDARQLPVCLWPAGAVHCSIGDLATYAADHLHGLRGRPALLPASYYERLHRRRGSSAFTLGWGARRDPRWGAVHFGAGSGGWFFARIVIVPEHDAAVALLANSGGAAAATRELWARLVERFAAA